MQEKDLLRRLRQKKSRALEAAIDQYGAYVATVARNVLGDAGTLEGTEEISADVFLALWDNAGNIADGKLKAWLGAVARNRGGNADARRGQRTADSPHQYHRGRKQLQL